MKMQRAVQDFAWREGEDPKELKKFKKKNPAFYQEGFSRPFKARKMNECLFFEKKTKLKLNAYCISAGISSQIGI
jgi:hypothetical protein